MKTARKNPSKSIYDKIYRAVAEIPEGYVANYGEVARHVGGCTARMVGYAMAALGPDSGVPWHRVVNAKGEISLRSHGDRDRDQRRLLLAEGHWFDRAGRLDLEKVGWYWPYQ